MESETWKPVIGYEGLYEVSNLGKVKSLKKEWRNDKGVIIGRKGDTILCQGVNKNGYLSVVLCKEKVKKNVRVHRLVAIHFCENPNMFNIVNHLDSNTQNNCFSNLEWTTYSGNAVHGFLFGLRKGRKGVSHHLAKINDEDVDKIKMLYEDGLSQEKIGRLYSLSQSQIGRIIRGERWKHIYKHKN